MSDKLKPSDSVPHIGHFTVINPYSGITGEMVHIAYPEKPMPTTPKPHKTFRKE